MYAKAGAMLMTSQCVILVVVAMLAGARAGVSCYLCQNCNDPYRPTEHKFYLDRRRDLFGMREDTFFQCQDAALCYKEIPKEDEDLGVYLHRFPVRRGCRYEVTHTGCREEFDYYHGFAVDVCVCDSDFCNEGHRLLSSMSFITTAVILYELLS